MAISGGRAASRVPVTILTGFLGSGKTTLLNYILSENHGLKAAVIVNEFGEVGIDHQLVVGVDQASGIVELSNGCICCSINTDLYEAVLRLLKSNRTIEYLIVETTGVADPQPVAQTFFLPELERRTFLDSIIALVDAVNFPRIMHESEVAAAQVAFADFVVINKVDDAFPQAVRAIERHIRHLNPYARILHTNYARVPLEYILDVGAFSLDKYFDPAEAEAFRRGEGLLAESLEDHSDCDHEHGICHHGPHGHEGHESEGHHHASTHLEREGFVSASFVLDRPLRAQAFQSFLEELPTTVYRGKGILWFLGESRRAIFQQVGSTVLVEWGKPWGQEEPLCQLVFIGTGFDKAALYQKLLACAARE